MQHKRSSRPAPSKVHTRSQRSITSTTRRVSPSHAKRNAMKKAHVQQKRGMATIMEKEIDIISGFTPEQQEVCNIHHIYSCCTFNITILIVLFCIF